MIKSAWEVVSIASGKDSNKCIVCRIDPGTLNDFVIDSVRSICERCSASILDALRWPRVKVKVRG